VSQFDMFAEELSHAVTAASSADVVNMPPAAAEPVEVAIEYAHVEPYEPRPESPAAIAVWTSRTQRVTLVYVVGALVRAPACREFFTSMARETLFKLDGLGGAW
jgi:hypothetical protein